MVRQRTLSKIGTMWASRTYLIFSDSGVNNSESRCDSLFIFCLNGQHIKINKHPNIERKVRATLRVIELFLLRV